MNFEYETMALIGCEFDFGKCHVQVVDPFADDDLNEIEDMGGRTIWINEIETEVDRDTWQDLMDNDSAGNTVLLIAHLIDMETDGEAKLKTADGNSFYVIANTTDVDDIQDNKSLIDLFADIGFKYQNRPLIPRNLNLAKFALWDATDF